MKNFVPALLLLTLASTALAQINTFTLRSKYGAPLDRESFTVRPGIVIVVDYGSSKQVCRIQLPSGVRIVGTVPPGVVTTQHIEEVLDEVLLSSIGVKK